MSLFDFPSASVTCEQRVSTNVPLQKLYFLNSDFVRKQSEALAARAGSDVGRMYSIALGRAATNREAGLARGFLSDGGTWVQLAQVLLSSNEFAFVD